MNIHLPKSLFPIRTASANDRPHPYRDWYTLVGISTILLLASLLWNVWFFMQATRGEGTGEGNTAGQGIRENVIDTVRGIFIERAAEEGRYRTEYRFVDPSV